MAKLSLLVPVYFNENNLPTTIPTLQGILKQLSETGVDGELICIDDGSRDRSFEILKEFAVQDQRIKLIRLVKNAGAHTALLAGMDHATGDALAIIMADLQDPPELLLEMTQAWKNGSKIVIAARSEREDRFIDRIFAGLFWGFMRRLAVKSLPKGGFDFVLFDRAVKDLIIQTRERNSHLMVQILYTGFPSTIIPYTRRMRRAGKSKWTFSKKLKLFIDSAIAFSHAPVRAMSILGILTALAGFIFSVIILVQRFSIGAPVPGWTSLIVVVMILGGLQMLMLGLIGEYLWRIFDESRDRPLYVAAEKINLS